MPHCGYIYIKSKDKKVIIYWLGIDYTQVSSLGVNIIQSEPVFTAGLGVGCAQWGCLGLPRAGTGCFPQLMLGSRVSILSFL